MPRVTTSVTRAVQGRSASVVTAAAARITRPPSEWPTRAIRSTGDRPGRRPGRGAGRRGRRRSRAAAARCWRAAGPASSPSAGQLLGVRRAVPVAAAVPVGLVLAEAVQEDHDPSVASGNASASPAAVEDDVAAVVPDRHRDRELRPLAQQPVADQAVDGRGQEAAARVGVERRAGVPGRRAASSAREAPRSPRPRPPYTRRAMPRWTTLATVAPAPPADPAQRRRGRGRGPRRGCRGRSGRPARRRPRRAGRGRRATPASAVLMRPAYRFSARLCTQAARTWWASRSTCGASSAARVSVSPLERGNRRRRGQALSAGSATSSAVGGLGLGAGLGGVVGLGLTDRAVGAQVLQLDHVARGVGDGRGLHDRGQRLAAQDLLHQLGDVVVLEHVVGELLRVLAGLLGPAHEVLGELALVDADTPPAWRPRRAGTGRSPRRGPGGRARPRTPPGSGPRPRGTSPW